LVNDSFHGGLAEDANGYVFCVESNSST
jgi:hypothetical protein